MLHAHNRRFPLVLRRLVVRAEWNIRPASNIYRYPLDAVTKSAKEYASIKEVAMTAMPLTVGSLFSGIGGFDLGLERAGMSVRWQVEIDPYCQRVLTKHWPAVRRYGDIRTVDWATVEPVDLLCGGFPCQDISLAGKGAGLSGARSGLWSEYVKAIAALKPKYILIENVAALRSRGLDQVLREITALGYDAEWHCIPASAVGAPHRRDRVWIVAYARSSGGRTDPTGYDLSTQPTELQHANGKACADHDSSICRDVADSKCGENHVERGVGECRRDAVERDQQATQRDNGEASQYAPDGCGEDVADAECQGPQGHRGKLQLGEDQQEIKAGGAGDVADSFLQQRHRWSDGVSWWEREPQETLQALGGNRREEDGLSIPESLLGRVAHGVPARVDRLRGLGNAIVPQIAEILGRAIMSDWTAAP